MIHQYENPEDKVHCVVNNFEKYSFLRTRVNHDHFANDGSGIPKLAKQPVGCNKLNQTIPLCVKLLIYSTKQVILERRHVLWFCISKFGDQLIKECIGHRLLTALHKYKDTGHDWYHEISIALLPPAARKVKKCFSFCSPF